MASTENRQMTDDPIVKRIIILLRERRKNERELTDFLGLSAGSISKWKYYGSSVYLKYIDEICEFLDTTPNYLFWGEVDEEKRLTREEEELVRMYRRFDVDRKKCIRDTMKYFSKK